MDYDKLIAPAAKAMRPSGIRKFFDLAAEMPECISLGVGEPDFKTPWAVREAGIESLEHGRTRYTSNAGLKELRAEISRYLERRMNLRYDPMRQILVTVGGSEAIDMCIRTLVQPGDEVIIPEPCFVCYEPITTLSGGVPVHVACRQEDEFRLRADALKAAITPKTKLVIMPFPNNPTGAVMEREDLEAVAEVLRGTDIMVLSDEIYAELNYGLRPHVSIATLPGMAERTIVVNGFSKSYAMTGWRLGYACGPEAVIKIMTKIHQSAIMSAPTTSQYAAITALKECDGEIDRMRDEYNMRRRLVVRSFNDMGLTCFEPRGAFYAFPCIKSTGMSSQEFCTKLLEQKHVAIIPGDAFGVLPRFLRLQRGAPDRGTEAHPGVFGGKQHLPRQLRRNTDGTARAEKHSDRVGPGQAQSGTGCSGLTAQRLPRAGHDHADHHPVRAGDAAPQRRAQSASAGQPCTAQR